MFTYFSLRFWITSTTPNYNQRIFRSKVKGKKYFFISENKLRNEDKKTIRKLRESAFHIEPCCLNFPRKLKLLLFSQAWPLSSRKKYVFRKEMWEPKRFSLAFSFSGRRTLNSIEIFDIDDLKSISKERKLHLHRLHVLCLSLHAIFSS